MLEHQRGQRLVRREGPEFSVAPQSGQSTETCLSADLVGAGLSLSLGTDPRPLRPVEIGACWKAELKYEPQLVYRDNHCEAEGQAAGQWPGLAPRSEVAVFFDQDQQETPAAPPKRKRRRAALDISALMGILIMGGALVLDYTADMGSEARFDQPPLLDAEGSKPLSTKITDRLPGMARLDGERQQPGEAAAAAGSGTISADPDPPETGTAEANPDITPESNVVRQVPAPSLEAIPVKTVIVRSDGAVMPPPEMTPEPAVATPELPAEAEKIPAAVETEDTPAATEAEATPSAAEPPPLPAPKAEPQTAPQANTETASATPSVSAPEEPAATPAAKPLHPPAAKKTAASTPRDAERVAVPLPARRPAYARLRRPVPPPAAEEPQWQAEVFAR